MPPAVDVPVLTDDLVTLRARRIDDVDEVTRMTRDAESRRWTTVPDPYTTLDAEQFITEMTPAGWRDQTAYGWAIEAPDDDGVVRFAGHIDIRAGTRPDVGFMLHPWARGRGVMARALRLATRWSFDVIAMPVVHWETYVGNLGSWRVAWACGFTFHGEVPAYAPQRGELRDAWLGSLRPGDDGRPRTTWWDTPILDGTTVRLRPHIDADLPRMVQACSDPVTRHWLPSMPHPYTAEDARAFVTKCRLQASLGQRIGWAVADRATDRLLGDIGLFRLDDAQCPGSAEMGYLAHPDARGRGVVGEAVDLALAHAFRPTADGGLGRHRVQLGASWRNAASRRVAERAGFSQVGRFRLDRVVGASEEERALEDCAWYDLLATDRSRH
ncbi:MAG: GNAT family N-acetyltransferase [Nocardioidaceae bacterium]|nr:GNAT family N-acetyltransferase [Nocardioidaceae bacterium]